MRNPPGSAKGYTACWGCSDPATTTNAGWPVCADCKAENVGVDVEGIKRSRARKEWRKEQGGRFGHYGDSLYHGGCP